MREGVTENPAHDDFETRYISPMSKSNHKLDI